MGHARGLTGRVVPAAVFGAPWSVVDPPGAKGPPAICEIIVDGVDEQPTQPAA